MAGSNAAIPQTRSPPRVVTPPPQTPAPVINPAPAQRGFIPPQIMRVRGLEGVIGQSEAQLERQFGKARLNVWEGDARKLQFVEEACVLDVYLYPLRPGATPSATHVEARRASDGRNVDRVACVRALQR
ncbi:MAG: hypothetical protein ABJ239_05315 [Erythrobacter sp.]